VLLGLFVIKSRLVAGAGVIKCSFEAKETRRENEHERVYIIMTVAVAAAASCSAGPA
jgi:hypothetical protein